MKKAGNKNAKYTILTIIVILLFIGYSFLTSYLEVSKFKNKTYLDIAVEFDKSYNGISMAILQYYGQNQSYPTKTTFGYVDFSKIPVKEPELFKNQGVWIIDKHELVYKLNENSLIDYFKLRILVDGKVEKER